MNISLVCLSWPAAACLPYSWVADRIDVGSSLLQTGVIFVCRVADQLLG